MGSNFFYYFHDTILIRLFAGNRTQTDFETSFRFDFDFCGLTIQFLLKEYRKENWNGNRTENRIDPKAERPFFSLNLLYIFVPITLQGFFGHVNLQFIIF